MFSLAAVDLRSESNNLFLMHGIAISENILFLCLGNKLFKQTYNKVKNQHK